jgi:hypothetical protein
MTPTDIQIKNLKPDSKAKRIFDGDGLYVEVSPAGGKLFRFKYRFNGKAINCKYVGCLQKYSLSKA